MSDGFCARKCRNAIPPTGGLDLSTSPHRPFQKPGDAFNPGQRHANNTGGRFQEAGFVAVPPCLWGSPEHGLDPPPNLEGVTLRIVKESNATYG